MTNGAPELVALDRDDYAARHVGRTAGGLQFFLTTPFVPAGSGSAGREYLALYLFHSTGELVEARIEDLGPRDRLDEAEARARHDGMLASLGPVSFARIEIVPFRVERLGVEFGFIPRPPEEPHGHWWVIVEPGDYMAFRPPWTSGEYDT